MVFYRISNYFIELQSKVISDYSSMFTNKGLRFFHKDKFNSYRDGEVVQRHLLELVLEAKIANEIDEYLIKRNDERKYLILIPTRKATNLFSWSRKKDSSISKAIDDAESVIMDFKLIQRDKLLNSLLMEKRDLSECLQAFSDYCFFDRHALWVYNSYTNFFCCMDSSHPVNKEYIGEQDNSTLYQFLHGNKLYEYRTPNKKCVNQEFARKMKTINRVRLDLGDDGEVGILDLLSAHKDFILRDDTRKLIKNFVETKYLEFRQKSQVVLHNVEEYFSQYKPGQIIEFLHGLTQKICEELNFQACSIFTKKSDIAKLQMVAVTDTKQTGKPKQTVEYDLNKKTFTGNVFKTGKFDFSYNLAFDPKNSHTYDEATEEKGKTWIAIQLNSEDKTWGVLRVKNKHSIKDNKKLTNLLPSDFRVLKTICTHLSNLFSIEEEHKDYADRLTSLQLKSTEFENRFTELKNFYNVFLHEIRTPISTFSTSPLRIKRILKTSPLAEDIKKSLTNKVDDIKVMGERLAFIANTYYFHELVKSRKPERLSVLADIVFPVLNISKGYIKKQYDVEISLNVVSLEGFFVYGDKMLLNIVFNTIISNAGKYSPGSKKPIIVSGEYDQHPKYFYIVVSNHGFRIHPDEKDKIFENSTRGREVEKQKIGGTGIGLHLAKEIMKNQHGDLLLTSFYNPITFKIKIQGRKWQGGK